MQKFSDMPNFSNNTTSPIAQFYELAQDLMQVVDIKEFICILCEVRFRVFKALSFLGLTFFFSISALPYQLGYAQNPEINLAAIASIESSANPGAIGDDGHSWGLYQLSQGTITEYNRAHKTTYLLQDALDETIAQKIASWCLDKEIPRLLRHFKKPVNTANILIAYNCGIKCVIKNRLPLSTRQYLKKYKKLTEVFHG